MQSTDTDRITIQSEAPRIGPIGRLVRVLGAAIMALFAFDWLEAGMAWFGAPSTPSDPWVWVVTGLAVYYGLHQLADSGFGPPWGDRALWAAGVLAVVIAVFTLVLHGELWAPPLTTTLYGFDVAFLFVVSLSYLVAVFLGTPGCEVGGLGELIRRLRRVPDPNDHQAMWCIAGIHRLDDWEANRREDPSSSGPDAVSMGGHSPQGRIQVPPWSDVAHGGTPYGRDMTLNVETKSDTATSQSPLARVRGWLLIFLAVPLGVGSGFLVLLGIAATTGSRVAAAVGAALTLVLVTGGMARFGTRGATRRRRIRRWLPAVMTGATLAVTATVTALLMFAPAPSYTPFAAADGWEQWELSTGSGIAYQLSPAQGAPQPTPVILVHGGPGAPEGGLDVAASTLSDAGFDVYQYHQLGAGLSERSDDVTDYTVERHVADLDALRQRIGSERVILVGESWGGTLIAHYLATHSEHVAKAVVSSPGPIWAPVFKDTGGLVPTARQEQREVISHHPRFMLAHVLIGIAGPRAAHTLLPDKQMDSEFEDLVGRLDLWSGCSTAQHPGREAVHDRQAGVGFWANAATALDARQVADPRTDLRDVPTPVLVLRSECDYRAWEATREYRDLLPNAIMLTVENAGHIIPNDRPELYRRAVRAFLLDEPLPQQPYTGREAPW